MKFKVGEIYRDREGREYKFLMYAPEAHETSQLIFMELVDRSVHTRFTDGTIYLGAKTPIDILPPEMKTVKLYPALLKSSQDRGYFISATLYETKPDDAIRLITEWPPVIIEVEE